MATPIAFENIEIPLGEGAFPASATLTFEANHAAHSGPAQSIVVGAGRRGTWLVRFRPEALLPAGSQIAYRKVENEFRFDWRHQDYWPQAMGYVTVEDAQGRPVPFECERILKAAAPAVVTLPRDLAAGEEIVIRIGDQRQGGVGLAAWPVCYERARLAAAVRLPDETSFRAAPGAEVSVRIVPCPPARRYHFWAPSVVRPGEAAEAVALPVDANGNPLPGGRRLEVSDAQGSTLDITPDGPQHTARVSVRLQEPGIARLALRDPETGLAVESNPIRVARDGARVYWGEFHCHGFDGYELNVLNANTHPANAFAYGRDVTRLDFVAMGSHIFRQAPRAVEEWWELYREAAGAHDAPGRYVTFLGCEWRDREDAGGDRNLVWLDPDAPMPDPTWRIEEIYARFPAQRAMTVPHVGGAIAFPCRHDPAVERLCEMTSGHGNFEWFAQAYLQKGYRVGLIGGSDGHKGTPGHPRVVSMEGGRFFNLLRRRDAGWMGGPLLAVCAERLERETLWSAFQSRRVYASTGARALVDLFVNDAPMGAEITVRGEVRIDLAVEGTAPVARVDLIRGAFRLARWEPGERSISLSLRDHPPAGETYYYLRIEQEDGEMLWSSPVWVRQEASGGTADLPAWNAHEEIDLASLGENEATPYLADLLAYLRTEETVEGFAEVTPYRVVRSPLGDYAVFLAYVRGVPIRIHWFYGFELPRLRLEVGWAPYGREIIKGQPWTTPLFAGQDGMG